MANERTPPTIPDYQLLRRIGFGAYGDVWLARNVLGQLRAVKLIFRSRFHEARPFEREFEGLQHFEPISRSHPSQLAILHVGKNEAAGCFYYVMELADDAPAERARPGKDSKTGAPASIPHSAIDTSHSYVPHTLRYDLEQHGRLPISDCVQIGLSLTTALAHLHQHGLVHRDIKPSNVIFVNGVAKLGDIGLVTEAGDTQSIVGTEGYLPPEGPGAAPADIFSLGKVLYEVSTGMDRRRFAELPADIRSWPDFAAAVEFNEIVLRACAREPARRYPSAQALGGDLEMLQRGRSVRQRYTRQHHWAILKQGGLAAALVAIAIFVVAHFTSNGTDHYAKSPIPRVNFLIEQGFVHIRGETASEITNALANFTEAVQLDPTFLPGLNGLYYAHFRSPGGSDWLETLRGDARNMAILAPKSSETYAAVGAVKWHERRFFEALADAHRATNLRAVSMEGSAYAHLEYGFFLSLIGDSAAAAREYQKAYEIYPLDPIIQDHLGQPYFMQRKFRKAMEYFLESVKLQPDHLNGHNWLRRTYEELGHFDQRFFDQAIEECKIIDRLSEVDGANRKSFYQELSRAAQDHGSKGYWGKRLDSALNRSPQDFYEIANLYAHLDERPSAYEYLRQALEHQEFMEDLMFEPWWDHQDSEFQAIARKVGLMR